MKKEKFVCVIASLSIIAGCMSIPTSAAPSPKRAVKPFILTSDALRQDVKSFNAGDEELYPDSIDNAHAWDFLSQNIPLFDCLDPTMRQIYNFRWWTYRKHLRRTPAGWIVTEFLPNVGWACKYNSLNCVTGKPVAFLRAIFAGPIDMLAIGSIKFRDEKSLSGI